MTESHRIPGWKDRALFTLGPLTTSCTVKQAMLRDLGSRDLELIEIVRSIRGRLLDLGTVLISTVKGDVHNIGKNIVTTVLGIKGFKVVDTGVDNSTLDIIEEAQKARADIIALSSLMTTTMPAQKEVIDVLGEMNLRDQFFVMVGGGPVTQEWGDEIGADGYGKSAIQAAETAKRLMLLKG